MEKKNPLSHNSSSAFPHKMMQRLHQSGEILFCRARLFSSPRFSINNRFSSAVSQIKASQLISWSNSTLGSSGKLLPGRRVKGTLSLTHCVLCLCRFLHVRPPALAHQACCLYCDGRHGSSRLHACLLRKPDSSVSAITWCLCLGELQGFCGAVVIDSSEFCLCCGFNFVS